MGEETDHLEGFWGRINHPVFGVFASAWLVINWELVYTLLRGLTDVPATIVQINTIYLASARFGFLIWKPVWVTFAFLVLAPIFRKSYELWKEFVEIGRQWISMKMNRQSPVPGYELVSKDSQINQLQIEVNNMRNAFQLMDPQFKSARVTDPNSSDINSTVIMELPQLLASYKGLIERNRFLTKENNELLYKAEQAVQHLKKYEELDREIKLRNLLKPPNIKNL